MLGRRIGGAVMGALLALLAESAARAAEAPANYQFVEVKGVKIRYVVEGQGTPVVLLHGWYSNVEMNWRMPGIMAALAVNHKVIALDLPGHGGSGKPTDAGAYGVQMSEDVIALMDHLKVPKAHIVGYSLGGIVALRLIVDHPDRVLSGTLAGMGWLREGSTLQKMWAIIPSQEGFGPPAACTQNVGKLAITEAQLKSVKTPMIVLMGDRDPVAKLYVPPLEAVRKDWPVVTIQDAGHLSCIVKQQFKDELISWLDKGRAGGDAARDGADLTGRGAALSHRPPPPA